jgi:hypothetical protein
VLSGRDLRAGGTWLGINEHGNIAFLYVSSSLTNLWKASLPDVGGSWRFMERVDENLTELKNHFVCTLMVIE